MSGNRLDRETSPYLRQHKDNPVDWRPWDAEALAEAKAADKPILLSVGYAACHWCHVMAHESFENPAIAALMNEYFIPIKVDREERPDIDWIYQHALGLSGQQGGWPLTMFLAPDGKPFWGGTYFPPEPRYGRPGFIQILRGVAESYADHGERVLHNIQALQQGLQSLVEPRPGEPLPKIAERQIAVKLLDAVDRQRGGLTGAPKFPQTPLFSFLWRHGVEGPQPETGIANKDQSDNQTTPPPQTGGESGETVRADSRRLKDAVLLTLRTMCQGGIYDHLGGGFARYSTDADWLAPHFEKMLYDNALLLELLAEAWRDTQEPLFAERISETTGWLLREMRAEAGGFAAALDADSPGGEGAYYIWDEVEIDKILKGDSDFFKAVYDVTPGGNWEGKCILNRLKQNKSLTEDEDKKLIHCKSLLLSERQQRSPPQRDGKVLADWNGMIIAALARVGTLFNDPQLIETAAAAYDGVRAALANGDRLHHSLCDGRAGHPATLDDYAQLARAALILHETTGRPDMPGEAEHWVSILNADYWDDQNGGYRMTEAGRDDLIIAPKTAADQATPAGNAVACEVLARLYLLTGQNDYRDRAETLLAAFAGEMSNNPVGHCALLNARAWLDKPLQIVLVGSGDDPALTALHDALKRRSLPTALVLRLEDGAADALPPGHPARGKTAQDGRATAYVCRGPVCGPPVTAAEDLLTLLDP